MILQNGPSRSSVCNKVSNFGPVSSGKMNAATLTLTNFANIDQRRFFQAALE